MDTSQTAIMMQPMIWAILHLHQAVERNSDPDHKTILHARRLVYYMLRAIKLSQNTQNLWRNWFHGLGTPLWFVTDMNDCFSSCWPRPEMACSLGTR